MGDRSVLTLRYTNHKSEKTDIGIYVHWYGSELPRALYRALDHHARWDDDSYLARIIVSEIISEVGIDDTTGLGITPGNPFGEGGPIVDLSANTVRLEGRWGGDSSSQWSDAIPDGVYSFAEYITLIDTRGDIF